MKISTKVLMMVASSLLALSCILLFLSKNMSEEIIQKAEQEIIDVVIKEKQIALAEEMQILESFVKNTEVEYQASNEAPGVLTSDILNNLSKLRFGLNNGGYVTIIDSTGKILMHPVRTEWNGENKLDVTDKNGLKVYEKFIQTSETDEYVLYAWESNGKTSRKLGNSRKIQLEGKDVILLLSTDIEPAYSRAQDIAQQIDKGAHEDLRNFIITAIAIIALFVILAIVYTKISITKPLNELISRARNLSSGDGDLTRKLEIFGKDETALASMAINDFIEKVRILINDAKSLSSENSSVANELSSTSLQTGKRVEDSTAIVTETSNSCNNIQQNMKISIENAKRGKEDLQKATGYIKEANAAIGNLSSEIMQTAQKESELASKIDQLSKDAEQVKGVLSVINDIADQTNLLALNAAIEAARAGEHGRGFAVVADEVRQLAERTQKSLTEINATINVIVQAISESSEQMNISSTQIQELTSVASSVESTIRVMSNAIGEAIKLSDTTIEDYVKTGNSIEQIVSGMNNINAISTENARSVEEIASAAEHLNRMTDTLNAKLGEFRT